MKITLSVILLFIFILFNSISIIVNLASIGQIFMIDNQLVNDTIENIEKDEDKDLMIELFSRDILRCSVKKKCCIVEKIISIIFLIINIIILVYCYTLGSISILYGIGIYTAISVIKSVINIMLLSHLERNDIMCPMPSKYNKYDISDF